MLSQIFSQHASVVVIDVEVTDASATPGSHDKFVTLHMMSTVVEFGVGRRTMTLFDP